MGNVLYEKLLRTGGFGYAGGSVEYCWLIYGVDLDKFGFVFNVWFLAFIAGFGPTSINN